MMRFVRGGVVAGFVAFLVAGPVRADVTDYVVLKSQFFNQTSDLQPVSATSFAFASDLLVADAGDLSAASISYPGALSPLTMTPDGTRYSYTSGFLATQAQMDADYPDGATATLPASPMYAGSVPLFTGGVFSPGGDPGVGRLHAGAWHESTAGIPAGLRRHRQ